MPKSIVNTSSSLHLYSVESLYFSSSYQTLQNEIKKKGGDKENRWFYFWNETAYEFHERISYEQS